MTVSFAERLDDIPLSAAHLHSDSSSPSLEVCQGKTRGQGPGL